MAVFNWSTLVDGQVVVFDPLVDKLKFDNLTISAASVVLDFSSGVTSVFSFGGKTVTLNTAPATLTSTNVTFANGSLLLVGDNTTGTANDNGNNTLTGSGLNDQLLGFGGDDTINAGVGNDILNGGTDNDNLNGGAGKDAQSGGDGNDVFRIGAGAHHGVGESIDGGGGVNTIRFTSTVADTLTLSALVTNVAEVEASDAAGGNTGTTALNINAGAVTSGLTIIGNNGANVLTGTAFADTLIGNGGNDTLIWDPLDASVGGGAGTDKLKINGGDVHLDLPAVPDNVITDIEVINLTGSGNNRLTLAAADVLALSSTTNTLRVDGNAGDVVATTDLAWWLKLGNVTIGTQTYAQYTKDGALLQVDTDINRSGIGAIPTPVINLSALNGTNGFEISGEAAGDKSGWTVSTAGDVNGDGFADLLLGAPYADPNGPDSGASYVVFGQAGGFAANLNLSALNGTNGLQISGEAAGDRSGDWVSAAGDVNGDGFADLLLGARYANPNGPDSGASYVVFGGTSAYLDALHGASGFNLAGLNGTNGFQISGVAAGDLMGWNVSSAGDLNGDGFADLLFGAARADSNGNLDSGASYVVFGQAGGFAANLNLSTLDGTNGFQLSGEAAGDLVGESVSSAGDVNRDGFDDLLIGGRFADPHGSESGASYVVFGGTSAYLDALHGASGFNLAGLNGTNGFQISGEAAGDWSGMSLSSAGDVNGDGFADLVIGAPYADPNGNKTGASYVVFGKASGFGANLNLSALNGTNGFQISGVAFNDWSGYAVSSAGDLNGDGFADLLISAPRADPNGNDSAGASYVVFGKASGFGANLNLSTLNGKNGFRLQGEAADDRSGDAVSAAGDLNGDGFDDLLIGARDADPNGNSSGTSYVVFGFNTGKVDFPGTIGNDPLNGNINANILIGGLGNDTLTGGKGNDRLAGGLDNDIYQINRGDGQDKISEQDSTAGNNDTLVYGATINPLNLKLSRQVNDLRIALHGTTDRVTIEDWYSDPAAAQVETIQAGGQVLPNTQVNQLIQDMASFTQQTGLSWGAAIAGGGTALQQQQFQDIIAANWQ